MPTYRGGVRPLYALKTIVVVARQRGPRPRPAPGDGDAVTTGATGEVVAVMNATPITAIRTAAVSGVATRRSRARTRRCWRSSEPATRRTPHIAAMLEARQFEQIRIAARSVESAERLAAEWPLAVAVDTVEEALRDADVVCTVTSSTEPVVLGEWLKQGAHVNAVGACLPTVRELDGDAVARATLFVDRRESSENEAGDYLLAVEEGAIGGGPHQGRARRGARRRRHPGRTSEDEITVFESLGLAVEDLAAAEYIERRARETGAGTTVEFF